MASSIHTEFSDAAGPPAVTCQAASPVKHRLRGALIAAGCLALLATSWLLQPRQAGHGTHRQLGMPACSFLVKTGKPCPSCGLTTSMAAMAHGKLALAFRAQPFGMVLFVAAVAMAGVGLAEMICGRDVVGALRPSLWWPAVALAGMLAGWGIKILSG